MKQEIFIKGGNWYKGNLHCHTTVSDGELSPEEAIGIYKAHGYAFLGLTDHNTYHYFSDYSDEGFLMFPAVECDVSVSGKLARCYHIVGFYGGTGEGFADGHRFQKPAWQGSETVQGIIDNLTEHGNLAVLAHPVWSRTELPEFADLKRLAGIEVYNNSCEVEWHLGTAELYWDLLLRRGIRAWGFASDDAHKGENTLGGWIVVKAAELSHRAICDSIRAGSFYASTGPEIYDFYVEDGQACVECSPAKAVHFMTYEDIGLSYYASPAPITRACHRLKGTETFVRAEIVGEHGEKAWSNPIFLATGPDSM